jgi:hypothetical protein
VEGKRPGFVVGCDLAGVLDSYSRPLPCMQLAWVLQMARMGRAKRLNNGDCTFVQPYNRTSLFP